jgi:branched-chain amino acid transport system substrate-binding protein
MAVLDVNRRGGIKGRAVQLREYRTGSYFVDARHAAERAIVTDGVFAIIGSNASSLSLAIAEVAEKNHVAQISNISTAEELTREPTTGRVRRYVFRTCGSDVVMGALLARFARKELSALRVAVLYEVGSPYSARLAQSFIRNFKDSQGKRETREFFYLGREIDFRGHLRDIAAFGPDLVFVPGYATDATLIAMQAASLGLDVTLLGSDAWSSRALFSRGGPARPAYYAELCSPPQSFGLRYARRFGHAAEGCRAVLAYDAVMAVTAAFEALGPLDARDLRENVAVTRERLRDAIERVDLRGQTGRLRFDQRHDRPGGMAIMEVEQSAQGEPATRLRMVSDAF